MTRQAPVFAFVVLLIAAIMLQMLTLPNAIAPARPLWVPMLLAYWTYVSPRHASLLLAWVTGLALDVLFSTVLGQHALGLVLVVYAVARMRRLIIMLPFWQTTLALAPIWAGYSFLMFWIDGVRGQQADAWLRWLPVASSTLLWPFLYPVLSSLGKPSRD